MNIAGPVLESLAIVDGVVGGWIGGRMEWWVDGVVDGWSGGWSGGWMKRWVDGVVSVWIGGWME